MKLSGKPTFILTNLLNSLDDKEEEERGSFKVSLIYFNLTYKKKRLIPLIKTDYSLGHVVIAYVSVLLK